jgi:hypothetical protein
MRIIKNGLSQDFTSSATTAVASNHFTVSGLGGSTSGCTGGCQANLELAELVVLYSALLSPERERLEGYLAHKWGIAAKLPADHPYKDAAPVDTAPSAPTVTSVLSVEGVSQQVNISWSVADNGGEPITDYVIQYRVSPSGDWTTFDDGISTATTTSVTGLTNDVVYDLRIAAVNSIGMGSWSSPATATGTIIGRYDFGRQTSPVQSGFMGVNSATIFSSTAAYGKSGSAGFVTRPSEVLRSTDGLGKTSVNLYADSVIGTGTTGGTSSVNFRVRLPNNSTGPYRVRAYFGDRNMATSSVITGANSTQIVSGTLESGIADPLAFPTATALVSDTDADGILTFTFTRPAGYTGYWSVIGMEIADGLLPNPAP